MSQGSTPEREMPATNLRLSPELINEYVDRAHQMRSEALWKALRQLIWAPRRLLEHVVATRRKSPGTTAYS